MFFSLLFSIFQPFLPLRVFILFLTFFFLFCLKIFFNFLPTFLCFSFLIVSNSSFFLFLVFTLWFLSFYSLFSFYSFLFNIIFLSHLFPQIFFFLIKLFLSNQFFDDLLPRFCFYHSLFFFMIFELFFYSLRFYSLSYTFHSFILSFLFCFSCFLVVYFDFLALTFSSSHSFFPFLLLYLFLSCSSFVCERFLFIQKHFFMI